MRKVLMMVVALSIGLAAKAQTADMQYKNVLMDYMKVSGTMATLDVAIDQVIEMTAQGIDADKLSGIRNAISTDAYDKLAELFVPVYMKYGISAGDIKAMTDFYSSPAGQKFAAAQVPLMNETAGVSQQWMMEVMSMVQAELEK